MATTTAAAAAATTTTTTVTPAAASSAVMASLRSGHSDPRTWSTGAAVRKACRNGSLTTYTSGLASGYLQVNLVVLPSHHAQDFRSLCRRNPAPCPLLAESKGSGRWDQLKSWIDGVPDELLAANVDLRHDFPRYNVYENGNLVKEQVPNIEREWTDDHVGFLIGCSFSFEAALAEAGLVPPHIEHGRNVPMYRTSILLCPAGVFQHSTYVVSMRAYMKKDIEAVRSLTRPYTLTHGEPIAWGWDGAERIGVRDINVPEWGDPPVAPDGLPLRQDTGMDNEEIVPVFWACGVTPQEAVAKARLEGSVLAHAPGHMLVLDVKDRDVEAK